MFCPFYLSATICMRGTIDDAVADLESRPKHSLLGTLDPNSKHLATDPDFVCPQADVTYVTKLTHDAHRAHSL